MVEELRYWLESDKNYELGKGLIGKLHEHGHVRDFDFKLISSAKSSMSVKKMIDIIEDVVKRIDAGSLKLRVKSIAPPTQKRTLKEKEKADKLINQEPKEKFLYALPDDLIAIDGKIRDLYAANRIYKGQIRQTVYLATGEIKSASSLAKTKTERFRLARQTVLNQKQIQDYWSQIDYYREHGVYKPGTKGDDERRQIAFWLDNKDQAVNYIRMANSQYRKTGQYKNQALYDSYVLMLKEIEDFIQQNK